MREITTLQILDWGPLFDVLNCLTTGTKKILPEPKSVIHTDTITCKRITYFMEPIVGHSSETGEEFRNRKGYFSLNIQAVCDAKLLFMNLVARWPGSAHDTTIFNNSELRAQCESGLYGNKWLLGDSAYPLKPYILTPLLNPQTRGELLYNEAHIRTRNCIERCFGVWKRRFPVVSLTLRLSLLRANAVIIATGVLHNICRLKNIADVPPEVEIPTAEVVSEQITDEEPDYTERATLISNFFNNLS